MDDEKYIGNSEKLDDALMGTTVSCTGKTITITCHDHETKDFLMDHLTGTEPEETKP